MSQVIKVWVDLLCSHCYRIIRVQVEEYDKKIEKIDNTEYCNDCKDWVFPIVITKREYDTRLAKGEIEHGVEIIHIDGEGIVKNLDLMGSMNKTIYVDWEVKDG